MMMNTTLVTACFDLRKFHTNSRNENETMKGLEILLKVPVYLIIHTDKVYIDRIKHLRSEYGFDAMTVYIEEEYNDLWCAKYTSIVKRNREKYWPTRDSRTCTESHLVCCNKFDFVQDAIRRNPFKTERFGWIDGSLFIGKPSTIKICENYETNMIPYVLHQIQDLKFHIQILNVTDKKYLQKENKREFYEQYRWIVCGSFFVCGAEVGMRILNRLKEIMINTTLDGFGHGEEMFYLEVLEEFPDDIVKSYGDYNQILNNFQYPTKNIWYILEVIIKGYFHHGYFQECMQCCESVLYSYDNYLIPMDYDMYMKTISMYYLSLMKLISMTDTQLAAIFKIDVGNKDATGKLQKSLQKKEAQVTQKISNFCEIDSNAKLVWETLLESL